MTGEELAREIEEVQENLRALSRGENPLSGSGEKTRREFAARQQVLARIAAARQKEHPREELYHSIIYTLLKSAWANRHPLLTALLMRKARWSIDMGI
jgi:hypothetical protein